MAQHLAAAKINLALHVRGRRDDGYHLLETLVVFAEYGDILTVNPAYGLSLCVKGPFSESLVDDADNLVIRAAGILKRHGETAGISVTGAAIHLEKNLPVASGLGGGSADAAATLIALCDVWKIDLSKIDLPEIALQLGADVPMCLKSQTLIARGIGEKIELARLPRLHVVLLNPRIGVSTFDVFGNLSSRFGPALPAIPDNPSINELVQWLLTTGNDLEAPAISAVPVIREAIDALAETSGCLIARMSGSGASCFGLYSTMEEAEAAAIDLDQRFPFWWCVASRTLAT